MKRPKPKPSKPPKNKLTFEQEMLKIRKEKAERVLFEKQAKEISDHRAAINRLVDGIEDYFISIQVPGEKPDPDVLYNAAIRVAARRAVKGGKSIKWWLMHAKLAYRDVS